MSGGQRRPVTEWDRIVGMWTWLPRSWVALGVAWGGIIGNAIAPRGPLRGVLAVTMVLGLVVAGVCVAMAAYRGWRPRGERA